MAEQHPLLAVRRFEPRAETRKGPPLQWIDMAAWNSEAIPAGPRMVAEIKECFGDRLKRLRNTAGPG
jgi:hypothetical protein